MVTPIFLCWFDETLQSFIYDKSGAGSAVVLISDSVSGSFIATISFSQTNPLIPHSTRLQLLAFINPATPANVSPSADANSTTVIVDIQTISLIYN